MIKEVTMYTIHCDRCGRDACKGAEYRAWDSPESVLEMACDGWLHEDGKDYCYECLEWNEDWSKLMPRPEIKFEFQEQDMSHLIEALNKHSNFGSNGSLPELTFRTSENIPNGRYDFQFGKFRFHRARLERVRCDPDSTMVYRCGSYNVIYTEQ